MVLADFSLFHEKKHNQENDEAHQHMQAVQSGHGIIEPIKKDLPLVAPQEFLGIGIDSVMNLSAPLEIFNPKEEEAEEKGGGQKELRKSLLPFLEGRYGESHGQAAGDEEECIEGSEGAIQLFRSQMKLRGILKAVDGVKNEESPEEKNLRKEKEPHPYL
jgi:hypothetical protein